VATPRDAKRIFNSRTGKMADVPPSPITQPLFAAHITGLCRAALSELLSRLPAEAIVISATTDGLLANVPLSSVDTTGPVMTHFRMLRTIVAGDDQALEAKHFATQVVSVRTRGCFTVSVPGERVDYEPILARAGQKLEKLPLANGDARLAAWAENDKWLEIYRNRDFNLRHHHDRLISLKMQWELDADLVGDERNVRVGLDYDLKRVPVEVTEREGCLAFDTRAPESLEEFTELRQSFDRWRLGQERVLRTTKDWEDFIEFRRVGDRNRKIREAHSRSPFKTALIRAWAKGEIGFPARGKGHGSNRGWTENRVAEAMAAVGIAASVATVNHASRLPISKITEVNPEDIDLARRVVDAILGFRPRLCELAEPGSEAELVLRDICNASNDKNRRPVEGIGHLLPLGAD
jgi:hypothetical protein